MPHYTVDLRFGEFRVTEQNPGTGVSVLLHGGMYGGAVLRRKPDEPRHWDRLDWVDSDDLVHAPIREYPGETVQTVNGQVLTINGLRTIKWTNLIPGDYVAYAVFVTASYHQVRLLGFRVNADGEPTSLVVDPAETGVTSANFEPVSYSPFTGRQTEPPSASRYLFEPDRPQE